MLAKRQRLNQRLVDHTALSSHAFLIDAIELLITVFYKKIHPDKLANFKKWEREKIVNLGLADYPLPITHTLAKDVAFSSWDREKVLNFGLTVVPTAKSSQRSLPQPKEKITDTNLTPKISPTQAWKKDQNQPDFKNDNSIDDFFKILGYE